ncbi:MAG: 2-hydroxyacyl-CoA dehydratase [Clostridia bacterium]|nr:2-hydroxyacyl-CoA dehydratase [Clostridia bacterium]
MAYTLGIDIGSTTVKVVLLRDREPIFEKYERHYSAVREKTDEILQQAAPLLGGAPFKVAISGSAGLGLATEAGLPFVQEVYATSRVVEALEPDTSCVIELGGEDAKIIFFDGGIDERMNGTCAGGTGAFIDQMATLLDVDADELDRMSLEAKRIYPIASRCGVFAKTDIQPLLNQGASKNDVAMSIYKAVVNQTIAGLAQGKKIRGKVLFLGGPLYYCKGLRKCFAETLGLDEEHAVFPSFARFSVAMGAAIYSENVDGEYTIDDILSRIRTAKAVQTAELLEPLFSGAEEYGYFRARHQKNSVKRGDIASYTGDAYLGIDCGSTTTKLALISSDKELLYTYYASNKGDPVEIVREQLEKIYCECGDRIKIKGSAVTGYGEELIKNAFNIDFGMVETIAHFTAAKFFMPDVNFILDIGGQDIKCFRIKNGAIDSIMLNEACSSGCGSFLETFAKSLGCSIEEFATRGLFAKRPVDLGSRCTVFMNSSVKQAQKDGATLEDISAGLSISVVKNALYKVIRVASAEELGKNVVVQGGTFYNDAVLRAFEKELGTEVVRPDIAGLMGAFGAALYSMRAAKSTIISPADLKNFTHTAKATVCKGCTNNCSLTVNTFADGRKFISGNRCEKGAGIKSSGEKLPNLHEQKRNMLAEFGDVNGTRGETVGLPLSLGMFELLPLWHTFFKEMGFSVKVSKMSTRRTYEKGQFSIPSDTACYPAKIMHGHIAELLEDKVDAIFYPCLTYNVDEHLSDNHYNCPVVAYYSELLSGNVEELSSIKFLYPYLNINDQKELAAELYTFLRTKFEGIKKRDVNRAVKAAFAAYEKFEQGVRDAGVAAVKYAREHGKKIMILAGRPYHIDSEIGHGIDALANSFGFVVVSEDSVYHLAKMRPVGVLNQWTYHSRLYGASFFASENKDVQLVQLVSFGCGVDAITTDEVRAILEKNSKLYTQIKIDEIAGLGAVKIRLRSLIGAIEEKE